MTRAARGRLRAAAVLWAAVTGAATGAPARAQTVTLDEGTFRVTIGGRDAGTETFSIRQRGTGADAVIIARSRVARDGDEITSSTQLSGQTLRPTAYQLEATGSDAQKIAGHATAGRFSTRSVSAAGESMREHRLGDRAILVDSGIAHHYFFIAKHASSGASRVQLLIPREDRHVQASVETAGNETVQIGSRTVNARRITVRTEDGEERTVWVDGEGRVLRVRVPAREYVAERTTPPS